VFDAVVCFEEKVMEQVVEGETTAARRFSLKRVWWIHREWMHRCMGLLSSS
jgi:hypothetical protein